MRSPVLRMFGCIFVCMRALCLVSAAQKSETQESADLPYMNPQLSPGQRATDLVHRMTLAEKGSQIQNNSAAVADSRSLNINGGAKHFMG